MIKIGWLGYIEISCYVFKHLVPNILTNQTVVCSTTQVSRITMTVGFISNFLTDKLVLI